MALICCPECGKENVSDSAEACPNCGYGIREHFEKIKQAEAEKERKKKEEEQAIQQKRQEEEMQRREAERQRHFYEERKRLEEEQKKEQEEREQIEVTERLNKLERAKKIKYLVVGIIAIILVSGLITSIMTCVRGIENSKREGRLQNLAESSFLTDFELYKELLNGYGINVNAEYEFTGASAVDGILNIACHVTYSSNDINKYEYVAYNSDEAKELYSILKKIYNGMQDKQKFLYEFEEGSAKVNLRGDAVYGIVVLDSNGKEYSYTNNSVSEDLEINGNSIYFETNHSDDSPKGTSPSYSGSYDATLDSGSDNVIVCVSKDAMDRYYSALVRNNQGTVEEMYINGEIGLTKKGTKCNIIDRSVGAYKVKLLDGSYAGNEVYVSRESVIEKE